MSTTTSTRKIRIRYAGGSKTIDIQSNATIGDVATVIADCTNILPNEQVWKGGFPPKPLQSLKSTDTMSKDLDLIHVVQNKEESSIVFAPSTNDTTTTTKTTSSSTENNHNNIFLDDDLTTTGGEPPATVDPDGFVVRRVMDADNSCLFNSIGYCMKRSRTHSKMLRKIVHDTVLGDPEAYSEAVLEKPTNEYAEWISKETSWGGQIELSILSQALHTEIAAFDVIRNRHDVYGTENNYNRRILVIYDGIHYDALAYCFDPSLPEDMDVTQFHPHDVIVMERAQQLCEQQHNAKAFTDTSNFTLRCLICQQGLKGQQDAQQHAQQTGHTNFAEYR
jgi:ubiquitin thioesterase OTU1